MSAYSRRDFAKVIGAVPLGAAGTGPIPTRRLGQINFHAGIVGIGAQHLGDDGVEQSLVDRVIAEAIDNGVNYIDTAPPYNLCEERIGRALKGRRQKVFLVSKVETNARGDAAYQLRDSLRKLQTDYLDCVHLHNVGRVDRWPSLEQILAKDGPLEALVDAKNQGFIRHIGCTSHMRPARALPIFETGQIELFMCTINFVERHIYNFEEKVLPEARRGNIGLIAMKVLGGPVKGAGALLAAPEDYRATLRYTWGVAGVAVANLGIRTVEELRQALAAARSYTPLTPAEMTALTGRGKQLAAKWGLIRGPAA